MAMERCPFCGNTVFQETRAGNASRRICAGPLGCHAPAGTAELEAETPAKAA